MNPAVTLSALDLTAPGTGLGIRETLQATIDLAKAVETAGYTRFWVPAERGASGPGSSPDVLAGILAGVTSTLSVGPLGLSLSGRDTSRIVRDFDLLSTMYPGRIAVGLDAEDGRPDAEDAVRTIVAGLDAAGAGAPRALVLASTDRGIDVARRSRSDLCISLLGPSAVSPASAQVFRRCHPSGRVSIAVSGVCATSGARAERIAADLGSCGRRVVVGDPATSRAQLAYLAGAYGAEEVVYMDLSPQLEDRIAAYRILAQAGDQVPARAA